jgi:hypothetical protein
MMIGNTNKTEPRVDDRYGLFEWPPDGVPEWMESTSDVGYAKGRIKQLFLQSRDSEYFVQDFIANTIVASSSDYRTPHRAASTTGRALPCGRGGTALPPGTSPVRLSNRSH